MTKPKMRYYPGVDILYLEFAKGPASTGGDLAQGVVADYDAEGEVIGIELSQASRLFAEADVDSGKPGTASAAKLALLFHEIEAVSPASR